MNVEPTIGLAFLAGLVSFISPCVLPLIPAYVGYMGGRATTAASNTTSRKFETFLHGIFFVLGFTIFFVGFGLLTAAASSFLRNLGINIPQILTRLGGVAVIFFGLYVMKALDPVFAQGMKLAEKMKPNPVLGWLFSVLVVVILLGYFFWVFEHVLLAAIALMLLLLLFRRPLQNAQSIGDFWAQSIQSLQYALVTDTRNLQVQGQSSSYLSSTGLGIVFAAGWTPCIGPIYGSVLTLASESAVTGGSLLPAAAMLTAYSLGLGIPFMATALALNQFTGVLRSLKRNMRKVEYASGFLLIMIGFLVLTGGLEELSRRFGSDGQLGDLSVRLEACTAGAASGRIYGGSWGNCIQEGMPKLNDRIIFASAKAVSPESSSPLLANIAPAPESIPVGLKIGERAPDFQTTTLSGENISLSDLAGQVVLLNFWATWCGPCRTEMPEFQSIYEQMHPLGFEILALNFLQNPAEIEPFVEELGLHFPIGLDISGEINDDLYQIHQYPTSYLLDSQGVIVAVHAGPLKGSDLLALLSQLEVGG